MGIKQENEITMKVNCGISELCKILEDKGFKVVDRFTMNDIFMIPNTLKSKIKELTSREILEKTEKVYYDKQSIFTPLKRQEDKKIREKMINNAEKTAKKSKLFENAEENAQKLIREFLSKDKANKDYEIVFK